MGQSGLTTNKIKIRSNIQKRSTSLYTPKNIFPKKDHQDFPSRKKSRFAKICYAMLGFCLQEAVRHTLGVLMVALEGFVDFLDALRADGDSPMSYRQKLEESVRGMKGIDWLVPPMLQDR
jgi:hypothetical protein